MIGFDWRTSSRVVRLVVSTESFVACVVRFAIILCGVLRLSVALGGFTAARAAGYAVPRGLPSPVRGYRGELVTGLVSLVRTMYVGARQEVPKCFTYASRTVQINTVVFVALGARSGACLLTWHTPCTTADHPWMNLGLRLVLRDGPLPPGPFCRHCWGLSFVSVATYVW